VAVYDISSADKTNLQKLTGDLRTLLQQRQELWDKLPAILKTSFRQNPAEVKDPIIQELRSFYLELKQFFGD